MTRAIDLTGQKFNKLAVIERAGSDTAGATWRCLCDCGKESVVSAGKLKSGHTKSCGCHRDEMIGKTHRTHGMANKSTTYRTWKEMRQRCNNPNATQYKWYGQRGITICPSWAEYQNFLADMGERPSGKTLDRINPDGNYSPENCRWATAKEQAESNRGCFQKGSIPHNKGKYK